MVGILFYGSVGVYVMMAQLAPPYPLQFALPPVSGLVSAGVLVVYLWPFKERLR